LQAELSESDISLIKKIATDETKALIKKAYAPEIDLDSPFGQIVDLWSSVDSTEKTPLQVELAILVRASLKDLLEAGLERLDNPKKKGTRTIMDYEPDLTKDEMANYVEFTSRNALISHSEAQLIQMSLLAGYKEETPEETVERLAQDSAK
jgi:hypothetical protein